MASTPNKSKKPRNKPPKSRPAATSSISQPVLEDSSSSHSLSLFSPHGELFAYVSLAVDKHRLRIYDTTTGQSVAEHVVDSARISSTCWAYYDAAAHGDGEPKRKRKRKNQQGDSASAKLPPPGIILGLTNGLLILYSPAHGKVVKSISHPSSTTAITSVAVERSEESEVTHAWTAGGDGVVRLWDLQEGTLVEQWKSDERMPYSCLSIRPSTAEDDADHVELLGANYTISLLSASRSMDLINEQRKLQKVSAFTGHASSITQLQWDTRSRFLSSAEADRFIYLWDVPETSGGDGKVTASIPLDSEVRATVLATPPSSSTSLSQTLLALSASGKLSIYPLAKDFTPSDSSKSKSKVPTLAPKSTISVTSSKKGGEAARTQVIAASFIFGVEGKVRVARLAGGVRPVFDVVEYLNAAGEFLSEVSLTPVPAGAAIRNEADTETGTTTQRYTESGNTAVRSGIELGQDAGMDDFTSRDIEGELDTDLAELSLGQRLSALTGRADGATQAKSDSDDEGDRAEDAGGPSLQTVPASSLTRTLIQALHSSDSGLLETCLTHTNAALIQNTVRRLPPQLAVPLILACVERLGRGKRVGRGKGGGAGAGAQRGTGLVRWIRAVLLVHGGHLLTMPDLVARLSGLHATLTSRLSLQQSLLSLSGRLDMVISQIELRSSAAPAPLPVPQSAKSTGKKKKQLAKQVTRYVEGESEDDAEGMDVEIERDDDAESVEDVELGGGEDVEESDDDEEEEEEEEESSEEEEENEDEDEDDSDAGGLKMNGFIDDEADEFSGDEDEDESE